MTWITPVLAVLVALAFGLVLVHAVGWRHPARPEPGPSALFLFLLLFPLLWAAGLWLVPAGPRVLGAPVLPALVTGFLLVLLVSILADHRPRDVRAAAGQTSSADVAATLFGVVFWLLMMMAAGAIVAGYVLPHTEGPFP
jgi:hypothetical protein